MFKLSFIAYPLLMAAAALLVRKQRPPWRTSRIVLLTNLPFPICAILATAVAVATVGPAKPGETDAGGMLIAVYMMIGMYAAFWMLVLGIPASWAALHWTRRKG